MVDFPVYVMEPPVLTLDGAVFKYKFQEWGDFEDDNAYYFDDDKTRLPVLVTEPYALEEGKTEEEVLDGQPVYLMTGAPLYYRDCGCGDFGETRKFVGFLKRGCMGGWRLMLPGDDGWFWCHTEKKKELEQYDRP